MSAERFALAAALVLVLGSCSRSPESSTVDEARRASCATLTRAIDAANKLQDTREILARSADATERAALERRERDESDVFRRLLLQAAQLGTHAEDINLDAGSELVLRGGTDKEIAGFDLMRRACR